MLSGWARITRAAISITLAAGIASALVPGSASAAPAACPSNPPQLGGQHIQVQPGATDSLRCADLQGADLDGLDLQGFDLDQANLTKATLRNTNLSGADLSGATLARATLDGANLSGAKLSGAVATGASFVGSDLDHAVATDAGLNGANLQKASFRQVAVNGADLRGVDFTGANVTGTQFNSAQFDAVSRKTLATAIGAPVAKITTSDRIFSIGCPILFVILIAAGMLLIRRRRARIRGKAGFDENEADARSPLSAMVFTGNTALREYQAALEEKWKAEAEARAKIPDEPSDPTRLPEQSDPGSRD